jgi:hypothetical protein
MDEIFGFLFGALPRWAMLLLTAIIVVLAIVLVLLSD